MYCICAYMPNLFTVDFSNAFIIVTVLLCTAIIKGMTVKLIYVHWNETLGTSTIDDQNNSGQINSSSTSE